MGRSVGHPKNKCQLRLTEWKVQMTLRVNLGRVVIARDGPGIRFWNRE